MKRARAINFGRAVLFALLAFVPACNTLPAGRMMEPRTATRPTPPATIYLLRGWRGLYSKGIDDLAGELRQAGLSAEVFRAEQWRELAGAIARRHTGASPQTPLILIGFSFGADDAIEVSRKLKANGIGVDLLITIDPVTPPRVPANVRQCVNFYQSNGLWDALPWLRGIPLKSDVPGGLNVLNQNLRTERTDLLEPNTSHATIARNRKLHREIIALVLRAVG